MQPSRTIIRQLRRLANPESYLFTFADFLPLVPDITKAALKVVLHRLVKNGELERVCRGVYLYPFVDYPLNLLIYHAISILRPSRNNYLSFENVLSEAGIISQVPINWISLISTGCSATVSCGKFGTIEFIHTKRSISSSADELSYDKERRLWIASPELAKTDLKRSRPASLDLIQD